MFWKTVVALITAVVAGLGIWGWYGFPFFEKPDDNILFGTAVAALVTAIGTFVLAVVTNRQLNHNRVAERAYVKASPTLPGVSLGAEGQVYISLEIKNHGTTPARITDVLMTVVTLPNSQALPEIPRYKPSYQNKSTAFLVTNDWIFVSALMWLDDAAHVTEASQGKRQLFIFGYIDYIDMFEQRHRGGFARRYYHSAKQGETNLVYVNQLGYDYDVVRRAGDGKDWSYRPRKITLRRRFLNWLEKG